MKARLIFGLIALLMAGVSPRPASAQRRNDAREQILVQLANRDRAARGLSPLRWSEALAEAAHLHAVRMVQQNALSHQFPGEPGLEDRASRAGARFSSLAENVALGPSAEGIHQQWMNSPPHRANLLDANLDSVGIAVEDREGTLFAVEDSSLAVGDPSLREQELLVEKQLQSQGVHIQDYTDDARRSCPLDNGYAGSHRPSFVVHYATADLETLPGMLGDRIRTGKYHSAAVGACPSNGKFGFSSFRIVVLMFE